MPVYERQLYRLNENLTDATAVSEKMLAQKGQGFLLSPESLYRRPRVLRLITGPSSMAEISGAMQWVYRTEQGKQEEQQCIRTGSTAQIAEHPSTQKKTSPPANLRSVHEALPYTIGRVAWDRSDQTRSKCK